MDNALLSKDIVIDFLNNHGAKDIRETSNNLYMCCPLHGGDNPTGFVWNLEKNLWHCFTNSCGGGTVFDFIAIYYDLDIEEDFKSVVEKTEEVLGVSISRDIKYNESIRWSNYIESKKNKNNTFNIKTIGNLYALNNYRNFDKDFLLNNEVYYSEAFNRICCVVRDEENNIVGCVLRHIGNTDSFKWVNKPKTFKTGFTLYNLNKCIGKYDTIYIVEGITDVLNLKRIGIENVVCCFTATLTEYQKYLVCKYFFNVVLMYDNDTSGRLATKKAIELLKDNVNIKVAIYEKKDPGLLETSDISNIRYINYYEWRF